ncbi:MAG: DUF4865 family protein [Rhodoglobus sp.]
MLAMNYQLTLPQTFDMDALRDRIPLIGKRFDALPGLGFKAFLFREQGKNGSPVNQYAPFYVWSDPAAANRFLWEGGGFDGVARAYGRPIVQTWLGTRVAFGADASSAPTWAVRHVEQVREGRVLEELVREASERVDELAGGKNVHSVAFAVDPRTWTSVEFTLLTERPEGDLGDEVYEVPYLSVSDLGALSTPRPAEPLRGARAS